MTVSGESLLAQLRKRSQSGKPITLRRITPELADAPERLAQTDLLLLDHASAFPCFNPAAELLPLANANEALLQNATQYRELIANHPVIAGLCGSDPFRLPEKLLQEVKALGFVGVQNAPSIGLIDGEFRKHLEKSRISYNGEVAMLELAKRQGLLVVATVFSEEDARKMQAIEADILLVHPGPKGLLPGFHNSGTANPLFKNVVSQVSQEQILVLSWER